MNALNEFSPTKSLRRPCSPQSIYPRFHPAKVTDPNLVNRAIVRASRGNQAKYMDSHYIYNAYVTYNHYAGLVWSQGYREKAVQALRKAMSLPGTNDWTAIILRAKTQLNLAVFLSDVQGREECKELLAKLLEAMTKFIVSHGEVVIKKRKSNDNSASEEVVLEELAVLCCFVLHHTANFNFMSKSEAYGRCVEVCEDYLDSEHPMRQLVQDEKRQADFPQETSAPRGFSNRGLAISMPSLDETLRTESLTPATSPSRPSSSAHKARNLQRASTANSSLGRGRSSAYEKVIGRVEARRKKPASGKTDDADISLDKIIRDDRTITLAASKKVTVKEEKQHLPLEARDPFLEFQHAIAIETRVSSYIDLARGKEEMKTKSREFRRISNGRTFEDRERIRQAKLTVVRPVSVPPRVADVTQLQGSLYQSHAKLFYSNPCKFEGVFEDGYIPSNTVMSVLLDVFRNRPFSSGGEDREHGDEDIAAGRKTALGQNILARLTKYREADAQSTTS